MFDLIYNILRPSLKDLTLHYMDTDSFVLGYSGGKVSDEHMDLSNLDIPIKTNKKAPESLCTSWGVGFLRNL